MMFKIFRRPQATSLHVYCAQYFGIVIRHSCALALFLEQKLAHIGGFLHFPLQTRTRQEGKVIFQTEAEQNGGFLK